MTPRNIADHLAALLGGEVEPARSISTAIRVRLPWRKRTDAELLLPRAVSMEVALWTRRPGDPPGAMGEPVAATDEVGDEHPVAVVYDRGPAIHLRTGEMLAALAADPRVEALAPLTEAAKLNARRAAALASDERERERFLKFDR